LPTGRKSKIRSKDDLSALNRRQIFIPEIQFFVIPQNIKFQKQNQIFALSPVSLVISSVSRHLVFCKKIYLLIASRNGQPFFSFVPSLSFYLNSSL
jgi:hypothetical protein